ncbi:ABC transporter substrate-binding protein [Lyngbya aestuarii]|uniref:ABC transporter substrate-binding protein n=1 Tax=Lyngbya aestuarii TaxID=118322 RepID=UPI00403DA9A4
MRKHREIILLFTSIFMASLLVTGVLWLVGRFMPLVETTEKTAEKKSEQFWANKSTIPMSERISSGNKILLKNENGSNEAQGFIAAKQSGVEAIAAGNYEQAAKYFAEALRQYSNAPETLIYFNNARIGSRQAYTIAVVAPTATEPHSASEILRGVAQTQNEVNQAGGINGVPLKVVIANDDDQPEIAQQIAVELVKNPDILGVVGHDTSTATLAAIPVYDAGKLPVISGTSVSIKPNDFSHYFFRTVPTTYVGGRALADYMLTKLKLQNAAVFFDARSAISQSLKSEFVAAVSLGGGQVVAEFDMSDPSLRPAKSIEQAIDRGAKVLMLTPDYDSFDKALQVLTVNRKRLFVLGDMGKMYDIKTLEVGGSAAVDMVMAVPWHIDGSAASEFTRRSRKLWNADVGWVTAMVYDATQAMTAALKRSQTRQGIQQALSAPDFVATGASGSIRFLPSGLRNSPVQLVKVSARQPSRSGTGYDFVPMPSESKPSTKEELPVTEEKTPTSEDKSTAGDEKAGITEQKAPTTEEKAGVTEQKAPTNEEKATSTEEKASITEQKAPTSEEKAPVTEEKIPQNEQ